MNDSGRLSSTFPELEHRFRNASKSVHLKPESVFNLNRNKRSPSTGIGVHLKPEFVFNLSRNMQFPLCGKNPRAPGSFEPQKIVGAKHSSNCQDGNIFCGFPLARASPSWLKAWAYRHGSDHRYRIGWLRDFPIIVGGF